MWIVGVDVCVDGLGCWVLCWGLEFVWGVVVCCLYVGCLYVGCLYVGCLYKCWCMYW